MRIYRASRLEALVEPLWSLLDRTWPDNVLLPQTVIAAHPGMKQWLARELARHVGRSGISANIEIVLPSTWLDRLAQSRLGQRAVSLPRYQRQHLRWTLHEMLAAGRLPDGVTDPRVASFLEAGSKANASSERARRRFQLADRLAQIYSQYLVYRPGWLRDWQHGQFNSAIHAGSDGSLSVLEAQLLGPLWKALTKKLGRHRGEVIDELRESLDADGSPRPTLQVFGVSHLAPAEIGILRAYARQGLVALYVPDPCREYWGGLLKPEVDLWAGYARDEAARIEAAGEGDYWQDQAHPLLARWGRMGQHFFSALADSDIREDIRHWQDQQAPRPADRLQRLQESIRQLAPALMEVAINDAVDELRELNDASLRVHACHTRQRELEVLRDALLAALESGLAPGDMAVMTPDIGAYLALIPSVFGEPGNPREPLLPYHLADVPVAASHGLYASLRRLLDLPGLRVTATEVTDLLSIPELQRRMGVDESAVETLGDWLRQSRVAWSLDARHRAGFGVPAIAEHGFAWALDRMIAGYLASDSSGPGQDSAFLLPDGTELLPVSGIHGPSAEALGAIDRLLQEVQAWCDLGKVELRASEWARLLDRRLEAVFRIDPTDRDAREAWAGIKRFVRAIETEPGGAEENPLLHFAVVRDLLNDRLDKVPERQRFLMGGITFCGMVPQRAIPFRFVAVLGLNDGEFPRKVSDGGLDLMTRVRRMGDRDVRSDDRYLFLETLMSARERLHLSYLGENVKDGKARNPAAPLAELMAELENRTRIAPDVTAETRPWLVRHPLQPFDSRYFDGSDGRLFSYNPRFAAMHGNGSGSLAPFLAPLQETRPKPIPSPLAIAPLIDYYRNPARNLLERRLKLSLAALDEDKLGDDEPLAAKVASIETLARRVFFRDALPAWPEEAWTPDQPPEWVRLAGLLAPGRLGELAWEQELLAINDLLAVARRSGCLDQSSARLARQAGIDLRLDDESADSAAPVRLTGKVANVFPLPGESANGVHLLRAFPKSGASGKAKLKQEGELGFGERVSVFIEWAALRLQLARSGQARQPVRLTLLIAEAARPWQDGINAWDRQFVDADEAEQQSMLADLQSRIGKLVAEWHRAECEPRWYFDKTSWTAVSLDNSDARPIGIAWRGNGQHSLGERDYGPGYNRLLAGDVQFQPGDKDLQLLIEVAQRIDACISVHPAKDGVPA